MPTGPDGAGLPFRPNLPIAWPLFWWWSVTEDNSLKER